MNLRPQLALLALLCAGLLAAPARAQEPPPVTLEVRAGYDASSHYRVGYWFPVSVVVANDGPDLRGTVEWRFPGDGEASFRYELDLPRGARKGVSLPVVAIDTERAASVTLVAEGAQLARAQIRLDPIDGQQAAIGVISADPALLNSLAAATIANNTATPIVHLDAASLPSDATLLAGLDVIFIHDLVTTNLSGAQRSAIELWARLGGQLVVGGGARAEQTTPGLAQILPVEVGKPRPNISTAALGALAARDDLTNLLPTTTASAVRPRPGAVQLDRDGLLTAWDLGAGRVIFAAFDLAALRTWAGEAALWERVLPIEPRMNMGQSFRWRNENLLRDTLALPALRLPSTGLLLLLMTLYIVVVGPVNFLVLRRLRRVELAWVTTPLLVLAFTAAAYGASFALRGTRPQITQLAIVQSFEGQPQGQSTAFMGVFSPQRRAYRLDFAPEALVTPGTFESFQFENEPVTSDGATTGVRDLLIDVSALRTLMVEAPVATTPTVQSTLQVDTRGRVRGQVRLAGDTTLRDALIVTGASAQRLGDLRPGDQATVDLRADQQNFPDLGSFGEPGLINRYQVLTNLFGYDRFALGGPTFQGEQGIPDADGVYLLGWANTVAIGASIDGD
ncbi:MAG: hypothetical protein HGA45_33150, partial [Chloroflexales bacterium]|nr:hypothetical protein [Chloroflexales bacterium]